jgi:uncharacterized membrane-anchored protein
MSQSTTRQEALAAPDTAPPRPVGAAEHALAKVPEITAWFWITKILTTAMGEAISDFMNATLGPAIAVPLMLIGLGVALRYQFRTDRYEAWPYWTVVAMVSVFGTSAADALHVGLGIAYPVSTTFYALVLAGVFIAWYRREGTLSIHSIYTRRRERFYWATVLATFALGTAAGDMTATSMHIGYFASAVMFLVIIAIPAIAHQRFGLNAILAFWFAYTITRPLGASFADWFDNPHHLGGLALGTGPVSIALALCVLAAIRHMAVNGVGVRRAHVVAHVEPALAPVP